MRGENAPERKVASTGDRAHNHQVMSPTRSPLSLPGGAYAIGLSVETVIESIIGTNNTIDDDDDDNDDDVSSSSTGSSSTSCYCC